MLLNSASIRQIQLWRTDLVASTGKAGHGDRKSIPETACRERSVRSALVDPLRHGLSVGFERAESGIRRIPKPAILGNISAASGDTRVKTAAGTSPLITRSTAFP